MFLFEDILLSLSFTPTGILSRMLFATVREKADGKGHYARIMTRGLCAHNDEGIMRAKSQGDYAGIMIGRSCVQVIL